MKKTGCFVYPHALTFLNKTGVTFISSVKHPRTLVVTKFSSTNQKAIQIKKDQIAIPHLQNLHQLPLSMWITNLLVI